MQMLTNHFRHIRNFKIYTLTLKICFETLLNYNDKPYFNASLRFSQCPGFN